MNWLEELSSYAVSRLDDRVRDALAARGVSEEQIELYGIGCLNKDLPKLSYPIDFMKEVWDGRKLDDVYVFPLHNTLGELKGFQFRHIDRDRAGYIDYISEKGEAVLFGLAQAMPHVWRTGSIFLVEGTFDLFPVQRVYPSIVATLTARVVDSLVPVLRRLVKDIWVGYDMDATGRKGIRLFKKAHDVEFSSINGVDWPTPMMSNGKRAKDPNDVWETWGDAKFNSVVCSVLGTNSAGGG